MISNQRLQSTSDGLRSIARVEPVSYTHLDVYKRQDYGFVYEGVRKHRGIAWFPVFNGSDELEWIANSMYDSSHLICKSPSDYISVDIRKGVSIYRQFEENPEILLYVPNPALKAEVWRDFEP